MSDDKDRGLGHFSLLELFRIEAQTQLQVLSENLLALEQDPRNGPALEACMRAAHSLKGASRMVDVEAGVRINHALEDLFVAAQEGRAQLDPDHIDQCLQALDLLGELATLTEQELPAWQSRQEARLTALVEALQHGATDAPQTRDTSPETGPATERVPTFDTSGFRADEGMLDLFRVEVENHGLALNEGLLQLEQNPADTAQLEALMRASHSIKGAARMVDVECGVRIAHTMEDIFVAAQEGRLALTPEQIDVLLRGVDLLTRVAQVRTEESRQWLQDQAAEITGLLGDLQRVREGNGPAGDAGRQEVPPAAPSASPAAPERQRTGMDTAIRVSPESLNRLMGLAGEVRVESRWLRPFAEGLVQVKHRQVELIAILDRLGEAVNNHHSSEYIARLVSEAQHKAGECRHRLGDRLGELEEYDRRSHNLADRLNREVVASRMRPFSDGVQGFQRMVRDLARSLDKDVRLVIEGLATRVDRDILSKVEAPLNHLVRNAVDHGVETPDERRAAGKPGQATITLEAVHSAGMLSIIVRDDGRGIEPETLRRKVVEKGLTSADMAVNLSETELMEFLFLPGFSTREQVTEISGRGVGLDVVHSAVQEMRGTVRATSVPGQGLQFHMQLPLTLSVVRALLVEIGGEPYAFPLARIDRTLKIHRDRIETMEGRQYFTLGNQHIGMLAANQVLELEEAERHEEELPIVVLGERMDRYGLVVDRFLGERNLVVQALDPRLGKVQDISAAAILENGTPCLILDVDDLIRSIDILIAGGRLDRFTDREAAHHVRHGKRVLVVDDSITVREVERNMLASRGYAVDVAVDGMDGWNAVRTGRYDLVISDVDMPRMNGFEFVAHIKGDPALKSTPVMIVSYKDREEDRARGLEVGADYYLTKGSFHDETLLYAVLDLIGEA